MASAGSITWWGGATIEIALGDRSLVVDPYLNPTEPRIRYIFVTHEDYDHCHEPTLRILTAGDEFELLAVARSCTAMTQLDSPTHADPSDLEFVPPEKLVVMYPKHKRNPDKQYPGPDELTLDGLHVETVDSSERPQRYRPRDSSESFVWPAGTGNFVGEGEFPQLGYVITDEESGLTFYHPGDLHEAFDSQRNLRGRIDFMFFPPGKLEGVELTIVDNIRPRCIVPIHFRPESAKFPVPLHIAASDVEATDFASGTPKPGADPEVWRREINAMMKAHWYPGPIPPLERLRAVAPALRELGTELLVLNAGQPHKL